MDLTRLFTGVTRNDRKEFDGLVNRCHRQAYNIAYRLTGNHADADDLTQETFLRAYRFFDRYNRAMPFENWLYRIMSRVFIDELSEKSPSSSASPSISRSTAATAATATCCWKSPISSPIPNAC